jgi:hypothetical protein
MTEVGTWLVTARNKEHAEYLIRSRAEQRHVTVTAVEAAGGDGGMWQVTATIDDHASGAGQQLGEDTQVLSLADLNARD